MREDIAHSNIFRVALFCIVLCVAGGCSQTLNYRLTLGGQHTPPTFRPVDPTSTEQSGFTIKNTHSTPHGERFELIFSSKPNRSQWDIHVLQSPFDGVVHSPTLIWHPRLSYKYKDRIYGRYPTLRSATETQETLAVEDWLNMPFDLGRMLIGTPVQAGLTIIYPEFMISQVSPTHPWKRVPPKSSWSSVQSQTD